MKKLVHIKKGYWLIFLMLGLLFECKYDLIQPPPGPVIPRATDTLQAAYVTTPPNSVNSPYWSTANYHPVTAVNLSTSNVYPDGLLNMTGTWTGLSDFNEGHSPNLIMKAAYDSVNLYILIEWNDTSLNLQYATWLYNGPADPLKTDTTGGWTGQQNNDKVSLAFEIQSASGPGGTFSNVGCSASCHNDQMQLTSGSLDIWNWSLALSEPMGYSGDMVLTSSGLSYDAGQVIAAKNDAGSTNRSGPAYQWNGAVQNVTRGNGNASILDPAYFLLNTAPFVGNMVNGENAYNNTTYGCFNCHGIGGKGAGQFDPSAPAFVNNPSINRVLFSKSSFLAWVISSSHEGASYWNQMDSSQQTDVYAYIQGLSGVPGYYLQKPTGSNADIISASNVVLANVSSTTNKQYQVLLIRKLNTGNPDDAVFTPAQKASYVFGVALMDNDGVNHIGSPKEILTFLKK